MRDFSLEVLLDHSEAMPPESFDSPEMFAAWCARHSPTRSVKGVLSAVHLLPKGLSSSVRAMFEREFGPAMGLALIAGSQDDPEVLKEAAGSTTAMVRAAAAANPALPPELVPDLYEEICKYATADSLLRPELVEFLASPEGAVAVRKLLHRPGSGVERAAVAYAAAHPEVLPHWVPAGALHQIPLTPEAVRVALGANRILMAVRAMLDSSDTANSQLPLPLTVELFKEFLDNGPDMREVVGAFHGVTAGAPRKASPRLKALVTVLASYCSAEEIAANWHLRLIEALDFDWLPAEMTAHAHRRGVVSAEEVMGRSDWFEVVSALMGTADSVQVFALAFKRLAVTEGGLVNRSSASSLEARSKLSELLALVSPETLSSLLRQVAVNSDFDLISPQLLIEVLGEEAVSGFAGHSSWLRLLAPALPTDKLLELVRFNSNFTELIDEHIGWETALPVFMPLHFSLPEGEVPDHLEYALRKEADVLHAVLLPQLTLDEARASRILGAVPIRWLLASVRSNSFKRSGRTALLRAIPADKARELALLLKEDVAWTATYWGTKVMEGLNRTATSDMSLADAVEFTLAAGLAVNSNFLPEDKFAAVREKLFSLLGNDPQRWDMFFGLGKDWSASLSDLVFMASEVDLVSHLRDAERHASLDQQPEASS